MSTDIHLASAPSCSALFTPESLSDLRTLQAFLEGSEVWGSVEKVYLPIATLRDLDDAVCAAGNLRLVLMLGARICNLPPVPTSRMVTLEYVRVSPAVIGTMRAIARTAATVASQQDA